MVFTKENLLDLLRNNLVTVTFTKVNGEERVMSCTLQTNHIPNVSNNSTQILKENTNRGDSNISVWDMQAQGWRSFRVGSVKSVTLG